MSESTSVALNVTSRDRVLFRSSLVAAGTFTCTPADAIFRDSGPIGAHSIVFPRTTVSIRHAGGPRFVSTPNQVNLYCRGQEYERQAIDPAGDRCDWFALDDSLVEEAAQSMQQAVTCDRPFSEPFRPADPEIVLAQRQLVKKLGTADALHIEEEVLQIVESVLREESSPVRFESGSSRQRDLVEGTKELLAVRLEERITTGEIAREMGTTPFHLCRIFRRWTGMSIYAWRQQLRTTVALERLRSGERLSNLASELGFASHSHFTLAFRKTFGLTPSDFRSDS
ncbi:MAG: AraC family transcriptional regulator [Acidobacteriota bacterium]